MHTAATGILLSLTQEVHTRELPYYNNYSSSTVVVGSMGTGSSGGSRQAHSVLQCMMYQ